MMDGSWMERLVCLVLSLVSIVLILLGVLLVWIMLIGIQNPVASVKMDIMNLVMEKGVFNVKYLDMYVLLQTLLELVQMGIIGRVMGSIMMMEKKLLGTIIRYKVPVYPVYLLVKPV